jgi:pyruvate/2-oxoglutarate dehydrogenase complex dihydrolipoamide dehydrogenase (E3) component
VDIRENAKVMEVRKRGKSGVRVIFEDDGGSSEVVGTDILVAVGRKANVDDLGLDAAGIRHDGKGIKVDSRLRTSNKRVYAIGDVAGALQFTHVAGYHAGQVVRSLLFGFGGKVDHSAIPWVTFTEPELAHVGLHEEEARKKHGKINVLRWPYHENDRAQAERRTQGHIKIVATRRGRILGVTVAGAAAGEMIHMWTLALNKKMKLSDMVGYVAPYPTYSEIGRRAAVTFYAPMARNNWVRRIIALIRRFG